ncbi:unnamed protein product [Tuber aestivum]|uniref:CCHC-type domain-containing protein n=1 Tax=Tuber aestivum TaxID=59557 RepID=A0A292PK45_9PEZI|nr:unnamed protein product [Tuber aestivum]
MSGWDDPAPASGGGGGSWGAEAAAPVVADTGASWSAGLSAPIDQLLSTGGGGDYGNDTFNAGGDANGGSAADVKCRMRAISREIVPTNLLTLELVSIAESKDITNLIVLTPLLLKDPVGIVKKKVTSRGSALISRPTPEHASIAGSKGMHTTSLYSVHECIISLNAQILVSLKALAVTVKRKLGNKASVLKNPQRYVATVNKKVQPPWAIQSLSQEEAWDLMMKASDSKDFDSFKRHMLEYLKASPGTKLDEIEKAMRTQGLNYWIYALEREPAYNEVIVGPSGELDCKYVWTLNTSARPRRSRAIAHRMASTPEENMERLKIAGEIMPETKPFCHTCKSKGHTSKRCEVERPEDEMGRVVLKCTNCDALDHRRRDCPEPRKVEVNRNACRNCGEEGHRASDCTVPRQADENTECRKCGKMGHFSKECPERGAGGNSECYNCGGEGHRSSDCTNERVPKCRNCDERGHIGKDCPKPRDITRVKCNNCGEMGHFSKGCTNPAIIQGDGEPEISFNAAENSRIEVVQSGAAGAWGGGAVDNSFAETIGGWASNVEPVGGGGGGW